MFGNRWILRFGGELMGFAAVAAGFGVLWDDTIVAPLLLAMFIGMCGVSTLLFTQPELLYELP